MIPGMTFTTVAVVFLFLFFLNWIKVIREYERAVIFRLGKVLPGAKGPGLILVFAPIDKMVKVDLRTITLDVPPQDVITKDNVSVKVNAVVYYRVLDSVKAVIDVENYLYARPSWLRRTCARSGRGGAGRPLEQARDAEPPCRRSWTGTRTLGRQGVEGGGQVGGPAAGDAAGHGQARPRPSAAGQIIHADGEYRPPRPQPSTGGGAAEAESRHRLRYLQTLTEIGVEKNTTIVFPLPIDLLGHDQGPERSVTRRLLVSRPGCDINSGSRRCRARRRRRGNSAVGKAHA